MSKALENFSPKIKKGRIAPSGKNFSYHVEGVSVELPFAMADLVLLCDGEHSLYQILAKMYEKQGVVHFQKVIDTLLILFDKGFIENADQTKPLEIGLKRLVGLSRNFKGRVQNFLNGFSRSRKKEIYLRENISDRIERNSFFSELEDAALDHILNQCEVIVYSKGQYVIERDEEPTDIFFLLEGKCEAHGDGFVGVIQRGSFFGEGALRRDAYRAASVKAVRPAQVLRIPVSAVKDVVPDSKYLESFRKQIIVSQYFGSSMHFQGVEEETIEKLQRAGRLEVIDSHKVVFEDGEPTTGIYFLVRGSVKVEVSEEKILVLNQGELFGEISVMAKLPRTAKITTREPCFLFKVSIEAFWEILLTDLCFAYRIEKICEERLSEDYEILQKKSQKAS